MSEPMTREQAIEELESEKACALLDMSLEGTPFGKDDSTRCNERFVAACDMALSALRAQQERGNNDIGSMKHVVCLICKGTGCITYEDEKLAYTAVLECPECNGLGEVLKNHEVSIKTGEQILKEQDIDAIGLYDCPSEYGLCDVCLIKHECEEGHCIKCFYHAMKMHYHDQGNGVYIPVEGLEEQKDTCEEATNA